MPTTANHRPAAIQLAPANAQDNAPAIAQANAQDNAPANAQDNAPANAQDNAPANAQDNAPANAPANAWYAPSCETVCMLVAVLISLGISIHYFVPYIYMIFHHPYPTSPIITLYDFTATPLSTTTTASWNYTVSVSNTNPKSSILFDKFTVQVYYINHSDNSSDLVLAGIKDFGKFDQPVNGYDTLSSNLSFSIRNLGKKDVIKKFLDDQEKGSLEVTVTASFSMKGKKDKKWKTKNIFCAGVMIYFHKLDENGTDVFGTASPMPAMFQFYNP